MQYLTVIEKGKTNYSAYVPDVPGVVATGKTLETVKQAMSEALAVHLEGEVLPKAKTRTREDAARHAKKVLQEDLTSSDVIAFVDLAPMNPISLEIAKAIGASGFTQSEVAKRLGTHQSAMSRLADPFYWGHSFSAVRRLAEILGHTLNVKLEQDELVLA